MLCFLMVIHIISAGKKLAESIVKEKLAACVNIVPGMCAFSLPLLVRLK